MKDAIPITLKRGATGQPAGTMLVAALVMLASTAQRSLAGISHKVAGFAHGGLGFG